MSVVEIRQRPTESNSIRLSLRLRLPKAKTLSQGSLSARTCATRSMDLNNHSLPRRTSRSPSLSPLQTLLFSCIFCVCTSLTGKLSSSLVFFPPILLKWATKGESFARAPTINFVVSVRCGWVGVLSEFVKRTCSQRCSVCSLAEANTLAEDQIVEISSYAFLLNPCLTRTDKLVISQHLLSREIKR